MQNTNPVSPSIGAERQLDDALALFGAIGHVEYLSNDKWMLEIS
jgi:hypothetical protein